ncbi:hypothetical protein PQX77_022036 [Marasmius sp. AFHP31]|nr:hypothetical protein PQX77_022036 [Marasmius sp. AFHP31]
MSGHFAHLHFPTAVASYLQDLKEERPYSYIICSDPCSLIVLHPKPSDEDAQAVYEGLSLDSSRSALRVAIAAYTLAALPDNFILKPFRVARIIPLGCIPSPHTEMDPDEKVFQTHRRHADFDFFTLTQDESRARQFFRWKEHAHATAPEPLVSGARLVSRTDAYSKDEQQLKPCSPVDDLHSQALDHMQIVQRKDLLRSTVELSVSRSFAIEILSDLTPSDPPASERECAVYRCRLVSVDGEEISCPANLCVKLFDDRQAFMGAPGRFIWWGDWTTNEDCVRREHAAYTRLASLQGSLLPWYYGAHEFTLPDGRVLYGILMEYVDAPSLNELGANTLGDDEQIQLIKSIRHIVSALQCADVSQLDWHPGQLLCPRHPVQGHYAVLIDLTRTSMAIDPEEYHGTDDLEACYAMFCDDDPDVRTGLRRELVDAHFCWREDWDPRPIRGIDGSRLEPPNPYRELFKEVMKTG